MVIVSWVLEGTLRHEDADGVVTVVHPGAVQAFATGAGADHAEFAGRSAPTRFVQMAVLADQGSEVDHYVDQVTAGQLAVAASVRTSAGQATLTVVRPAGAPVVLPASSRRFVFVTRGAVSVASVDLRAGDSIRTTAAGPLEVSEPAGSSVQGEALVWDLPL